MSEPLPELEISVSVDDGVPEEVDELARELRAEIAGLDVESVGEVAGGPAPEGSKGAMGIDLASIGQMTVTLAPVIVPPLFALLKSWVERKPSVPVTVRVKVGKRTAEIEYDPTKVSAEDVQALIKSLSKPVRA